MYMYTPLGRTSCRYLLEIDLRPCQCPQHAHSTPQTTTFRTTWPLKGSWSIHAVGTLSNMQDMSGTYIYMCSYVASSLRFMWFSRKGSSVALTWNAEAESTASSHGPSGRTSRQAASRVGKVVQEAQMCFPTKSTALAFLMFIENQCTQS